MQQQIPSEKEVLGYFDSCNNWGRWGPDDQLGTMNYITAEKRKQAAALVAQGESVTCARPIRKEVAPDIPNPFLRMMTGTGERWKDVEPREGELQSSVDFIGLYYHGFSVTHLDALAHIFWQGKMYNGFSSDLVTASDGATKESIELLADGVVYRGVLLDIPRARGVEWLEPGTPVFPEDLEAAEKACNVQVQPGDVLFVRTGWYGRRLEMGPVNFDVRPGLQALALPWIHEREIAMLGGDGTNDVQPSHYPTVRLPMHQVGIVAMGLWLIDNANLEDLASACERYSRWDFLLTIGPPRIANGTGSPINPIAIF